MSRNPNRALTFCADCRTAPGELHADDCPVGGLDRVAFLDVTTHGDPPSGRYFAGGAYRDTEAGKLDFEGFLSPLVLQAFAEYMDRNRRQSDGRLRDSDNWQAGIPREQYVKSLLRHVHDLWMEHDGYESREGIDDALGGVLFNAMGYWYELLKERRAAEETADSRRPVPPAD